MKSFKFLVLFPLATVLFPLATVLARSPYSNEYQQYYNVVNNGTQLLHATGTKPYWVTDIITPNIGSGDHVLKCDGVTITSFPGDLSATDGFLNHGIKSPVRCAGSLYHVSVGNTAEAIYINGYFMSDVDFNLPLQVSTSTASGGGGGGTTETGLQPETFATVLWVSSFAMLFFLLVTTSRWFLRKYKK